MSDPTAITVRCSELGRALQCPASIQRVGDEVSTRTPEAATGSAIHFLISRWIVGGAPVWDQRDREAYNAAARYGAEPEEVADGIKWAWRAWEGFAEYFPNPTTEDYEAAIFGDNPKLMIQGHTDVRAVVGEELRIADHKTGWGDVSADDQLRGYAAIGLKTHPECTRAWVAVIRTRLRETDAKVYTREQILAWADGVRERLTTYEFAPGGHCTWCQRRMKCAARNQYVAQSAALLGKPIDSITGKDLAAALDRIRVVEKAAKEAREALKLILRNNGPLPISSDQVIELEERRTTALVAHRALPVLRPILGKDLEFALSLSKGKVEEMLRDQAGRGQKAAYVADVMEQLREAMAVAYSYYETIEVRGR